MAGWECTDRKTIAWDGNIKADYFVGDGTLLTNISPGTEADPHFMALSAAFLQDGSVYAISGALLDGSIYAASGAATVTLGAHAGSSAIHFTEASINHVNIQNIGTNTHAQIDTHLADGTVHFTSNALWTSLNSVTASHATLSSAYFAHAGDSSDPHGVLLTQTNLNATTISGAIYYNTTDSTASGAERMRNILIGTEASPGAASNYIQGTVYLKYIA